MLDDWRGVAAADVFICKQIQCYLTANITRVLRDAHAVYARSTVGSGPGANMCALTLRLQLHEACAHGGVTKLSNC